jgi:hypothetical protein
MVKSMSLSSTRARTPIDIDRAQLQAMLPGTVGQIDLPGLGLIDVVSTGTETLSSGSTAWRGHLAPPNANYTTDLVLSAQGIFGDIRTPMGRYRIETDSNGAPYATLFTTQARDQCANDPMAATSKTAPKALPESVAALLSRGMSATDTAPVDVLFVYTPSVEARYGTQLQAWLDSLVVTANTAMSNSRAGISFRQAGAMKVVPRRAVTGDLTAVLKAVTASEDRSLPINWDYADVATRRNKIGADIVVTLVSRADYSVGCVTMDGCMVGASWQTTQDTLASSNPGLHGYAVVDIGASDPGLTVAHEIGHLFGAGHDDASGGNGLNGDSKAYTWNGGTNGTLMSYAPVASLVFSSPELSCGTSACGSAGATNNAATVKSTRFLVAGYRDAMPPPPPDLSGLWFNAATASSVYISQHGNLFDAAWLSYDANGRATWYLVTNCLIAGSQCSGDLLHSWTGPISEGAPVIPSAVNATVAGSFTLDLSTPDAPVMTISSYGWKRALTLTRQLPAERSKADDEKKSGFWWMSSGLESGVLVSEQSTSLYLAWMGYAADGGSTWYTVPECKLSADASSCSGDLFQTRGGTGPASPAFATPSTSSRNVGRAGIDFTGPYAGTVRWTINGNSYAHDIERDIVLN